MPKSLGRRPPEGNPMHSANELDLPHLPIETAEFAADPIPYFAEARRQHPWLANSNVGIVVTDYTAMKEILHKDSNLRMSSKEIVDLMGARGTGWGRFTEEMMLSKSGGDHARLRSSVASVFTPRSVNRLRPVMRQVVTDLLDEWAPKGTFNFAEFAANFPIRVMFGLMGTDPGLLPGIRSSLEVQGSSYNLEPWRMPIIEESYQILWNFADRQVADRGPNAGRGDLLDDLIAANTEGALNDEELRIMLVFLFAAGYDTSKNLLTLTLRSMIDAPDVWKRCAEDLEYCHDVVEEQLRIASPSNIYRQVTEDFEYRGVRFLEGAMLILPLTISGRDASVFKDPSTFDPARDDRDRHLAFGRGMHICLGQYLARAQAEEGLHLIAQRITNPRLAGEVTWRPFPGVWGIRSLPIAFDPQPCRSTLAPAKQVGADASP
jgi:cytochrome P450